MPIATTTAKPFKENTSRGLLGPFGGPFGYFLQVLTIFRFI